MPLKCSNCLPRENKPLLFVQNTHMRLDWKQSSEHEKTQYPFFMLCWIGQLYYNKLFSLLYTLTKMIFILSRLGWALFFNSQHTNIAQKKENMILPVRVD
jgi:hypothetical protein